MFKLYDLDMNEIPLPEGVKPLDIFVGSIAKERQTEAIPGRNGVVDYGTNYTERSVDLSMWIISSDTIDYRLLRNELYALFDTGNLFYISETNVPSRVLKVAVDEPYIPERITHRHASVDVTCRTLDSVFWESTYTTLELHNSGYSAIAEKYGLVDNIDDEKVQYRFEPGTSSENLYNYDFEYGFISSSTGADSSNDRNIRMSEYYYLFSGVEYEFTDTGDNPNVLRYYLYEYDGSGNFITSHATGSDKTSTFRPEGSRLRIMAQATRGDSIDISMLGNDILPRVRRANVINNFTVYNAGNVTVEPESMFLHIIANTVTTPGGFTITNKTTGDEFVFNAEVDGHSILLKGMDVRVSSIYNRFRDTNRRFISLAPGDNKIEVSGGTFNHIRFDFRYLYK